MSAYSFNTDYYNDKWLAYYLKGTALPSSFPGESAGGNVYMGLSQTVPAHDGTNVTEPTGVGAYARVTLATTTVNFKKLAPGIYGVIASPQFAVPTAAWYGTSLPQLSFCFFDALTSGNLLHVDTRIIHPQWLDAKTGRLTMPDSFIRVGIRSWGVRRGMISEYLADAFVAHNYAGGTKPTDLHTTGVWVRLVKTMPNPADAGSAVATTWQYVLGVTNWNKIKPGVYGNAVAQLGTAGNAADLPAFGLCDASSSGNLLWAGVLNAPCGVSISGSLPVIYPNGLQVWLGDD